MEKKIKHGREENMAFLSLYLPSDGGISL